MVFDLKKVFLFIDTEKNTMIESNRTILDKQLLLSMKQGNVAAFDTLFRQYYPMLCAYGSRFVDIEDAKEIVQDLMLWMWESREVLIIESSLNQYLFKAVHHRAINLISKNKTKQKADTVFYEEMLKMLQDTDYYRMQELMKRIKETIDNLPESYKEAFVLHRFRHKSYKEIAVALNVSPKTIDYRIGQALKILRVELKDYLPLACFFLMKI